jgi:ATP-dependent DNA helicase RecG
VRPEILFDLFASQQTISGVGPRTAKGLERLTNGKRVVDLLFHQPIGLKIRHFKERLSYAKEGETITLIVTIQEHKPPRDSFRSKTPYRIVCQDSHGHFADLVFFHGNKQHLERSFPIGRQILVSGDFQQYNNRWQITHPDYAGPPDQIQDWKGSEPVYPLTQGLTQNYVTKIIGHALRYAPKLPEWLDDNLIKSQQWSGWNAAMERVHRPESVVDLDPINPAKRRLAFDEMLANQLALLLLRRYHKTQPGRSFKGDGSLRRNLLKNLSFDLTAAQKKAISDINHDMAEPYRMVRLLQGDVGSGKTVVAMFAMLNAIECGAQGAILAPTEILAQQHLATIESWAENLGVRTTLLTSKTPKKAAKIRAIETGEVDLVIGTHALLQESVRFKNLGCCVIDEQHRFGVDQRIALSAKGDKTDVLVMTATPIPRTLMLAAYGDLVVSRLNEKPAGRQEIDTKIIPLTRLEETIQGVARSLQTGQKVYWVCPLVEESEILDLAAAQERYNELVRYFPGQVGLIHGRMKGFEKEEVMQSFWNGKIKVLVATTVIEVGVNVQDATIMIIEHAERFGLAQLHQLRGRIGRGEKKSVCLLLYAAPLSETAKVRLSTMRDTNDGFIIAEEDLKLRGGGDLLGLRQSGLPVFKFASYEFHQDLLPLAHEYAQKILEADPVLKNSENKNLRTLLYLFEKEKSIEYLHSG